MIEIKNISKEFVQLQKKISVLKNISLNIKSGKKTAIVGPSGSGKTTLLSLIAGLEKPTSGVIDIDGICTTDLSERELALFRANNMGIVFQQFHLMPHLTALENVCLPLDILNRENVLDQAHNVLDQVGLFKRQKHLPSQLSGGECQRVAIARALVTKPKIILADEPSGNLDTVTGKNVMDLLFSLVETNKTSLVLVTHDLNLAKICDQVVDIKGGVVS